MASKLVPVSMEQRYIDLKEEIFKDYHLSFSAWVRIQLLKLAKEEGKKL